MPPSSECSNPQSPSNHLSCNKNDNLPPSSFQHSASSVISRKSSKACIVSRLRMMVLSRPLSQGSSKIAIPRSTPSRMPATAHTELKKLGTVIAELSLMRIISDLEPLCGTNKIFHSCLYSVRLAGTLATVVVLMIGLT